jgi:(p)ppGpp synthase/HD superfamily hydrolase
MPNLERAIQIAVTAHAGQTDKQGRPYILHPLRIMLSLPDDETRIAGMLHDVVEDTSTTMDDLKREGFSEAVLTAIHLLTRIHGKPYADYVVACKSNRIAREVKLADLTDNTRLDRNIIRPKKFESDKKRISKYLVTYKFLRDEIDETTYRELMVDLDD